MLDADECARMVRALNSHVDKCKEIAAESQLIGNTGAAAAMYREAAKAKQLSSKMVGMGTTAKNDAAHAAWKNRAPASHAAQRAVAHAAHAARCPACGRPAKEDAEECCG